MWTAEDHTADALLVVEAASWEELLAEAARCFGSWTAGGEPPVEEASGGVERQVEAAGADATATWVRFWRALLRLWVVEGLLACDAAVEAGGPEEAHARVRCAPADALELGRMTDVKAVTWHEAEVVRREDGTWRGRIVLDI